MVFLLNLPSANASLGEKPSNRNDFQGLAFSTVKYKLNPRTPPPRRRSPRVEHGVEQEVCPFMVLTPFGLEHPNGPNRPTFFPPRGRAPNGWTVAETALKRRVTVYMGY